MSDASRDTGVCLESSCADRGRFARRACNARLKLDQSQTRIAWPVLGTSLRRYRCSIRGDRPHSFGPEQGGGVAVQRRGQCHSSDCVRKQVPFGTPNLPVTSDYCDLLGRCLLQSAPYCGGTVPAGRPWVCCFWAPVVEFEGRAGRTSTSRLLGGCKLVRLCACGVLRENRCRGHQANRQPRGEPSVRPH